MAGNAPPTEPNLLKAPVAVALAWLIPGLGHLFLGHKTRGLTFLITITLTFWTGVAIGGVKSVHPLKPAVNVMTDSTGVSQGKSWWFFAQVLNGSYAMISYAIGNRVDAISESGQPRFIAWPSGDVASVYTGVAGLLNLLIIIDALAGAEGLTQSNRNRKAGASTAPQPRRKKS